jgi:hypothetical protein
MGIWNIILLLEYECKLFIQRLKDMLMDKKTLVIRFRGYEYGSMLSKPINPYVYTLRTTIIQDGIISLALKKVLLSFWALFSRTFLFGP